LLAAILFRRLNADLKLRQLVLFQPEERGLADAIFATGVPEIDPVFAERHALGQFQRTPCAAECVQLRLAFFDFDAARIVNLELDSLIRGRRVNRTLILPGDELPLRDFIGPIRGPVGESVDAPGLLIAIIALAITEAERLAIVAGGDDDEMVVLEVGQIKQRNAVLICLFDALAPYPILAVVVMFAQLYRRPGERRAAQRVA